MGRAHVSRVRRAAFAHRSCALACLVIDFAPIQITLPIFGIGVIPQVVDLPFHNSVSIPIRRDEFVFVIRRELAVCHRNGIQVILIPYVNIIVGQKNGIGPGGLKLEIPDRIPGTCLCGKKSPSIIVVHDAILEKISQPPAFCPQQFAIGIDNLHPSGAIDEKRTVGIGDALYLIGCRVPRGGQFKKQLAGVRIEANDG